MQLAKRCASDRHHLEQLQTCEDPVTGGPVPQQNMAALLATEASTNTTHLFMDMAIPYRGPHNVYSEAIHCSHKTEVGHHGRHHLVASVVGNLR